MKIKQRSFILRHILIINHTNKQKIDQIEKSSLLEKSWNLLNMDFIDYK